MLQPPWQAGIARKVIGGLGHTGDGGTSGMETSPHNRGRSGSGSSDGDSVLENTNEGTGSRAGGGGMGKRALKPAPGEGRRSGTCEQEEGGEQGDEGEGEAGDWFEINRSPNSSPVPGAVTGQCSEAPGAANGCSVAAAGGARPAPATDAAVPAGRRGEARRRIEAARVSATSAAAAGMPDVPDGLKDGVESCLEEACAAFQTSIRRAVLNYILLDRGQRDRVGTSEASVDPRAALVTPGRRPTLERFSW